MRTEVLLAGDDLPALVRIMVELGPSSIRPTIVEARRPIKALTRAPADSADVGIIALDGSENVGELYELFKSHPGTRFVLLAPDYPPDAALARVAQKHRSVFLSQREPGVVIAATVVALMTQTGAALR